MLDPITKQSLYLAVSRKVADRAGVNLDIVRRVCHSGLLEGIPVHHSLRGIYRAFTEERPRG